MCVASGTDASYSKKNGACGAVTEISSHIRSTFENDCKLAAPYSHIQ